MYTSSEDSDISLLSCAGLPEPSLVDNVIGTKISCAGLNYYNLLSDVCDIEGMVVNLMKNAVSL